MAELEDKRTLLIRRVVPAIGVLVLAVLRMFPFYEDLGIRVFSGDVVFEHYGKVLWIPFLAFFLGTIFVENSILSVLLQGVGIGWILVFDFAFWEFIETDVTVFFWTNLVGAILLFLYCVGVAIYYRNGKCEKKGCTFAN
ncbi:MAG: hypothetical protein E7277_04910 [Lachnospiraceae bacterium]|nr:hypothetical protein [Lachnospiraceae bacterium]